MAAEEARMARPDALLAFTVWGISGSPEPVYSRAEFFFKRSQGGSADTSVRIAGASAVGASGIAVAVPGTGEKTQDFCLMAA